MSFFAEIDDINSKKLEKERIYKRMMGDIELDVYSYSKCAMTHFMHRRLEMKMN